MTFDLGLKGDYENLYFWLDSYNAQECGLSTALIKYPFQKGDNPIEKLKQELLENVEFKETDRIYIVWRDVVSGKSVTRGIFLIGKRKRSPWEGFASGVDFQEDIDEL